MLVYRAINPTSERDSNFEKREFMLVWLSPFGGIRQYMFTSLVEVREDYSLNTLESSESIRSIPKEEVEEISLITESLSKNDYEFVRSILQSNKVWRVLKSGEEIPVSVLSEKIRREEKQKDYSLSITIRLKENPLLNV